MTAYLYTMLVVYLFGLVGGIKMVLNEQAHDNRLSGLVTTLLSVALLVWTGILLWGGMNR